MHLSCFHAHENDKKKDQEFNFMNKEGKMISVNSKHFDKELAKQHKHIEKDLKKSAKIYNSTIRLLLLGPGESGKSTVLKQMRFIHANTYSAEEKRESFNCILMFIRNSMITILREMERYGLDFFEEDFCLDEARKFLFDHEDYSFCLDGKVNWDTNKFWDCIEELWRCEIIKKVAKKGVEYHLSDSAEYFFNRVHIIRDTNYTLCDQDILRSRVKTTGIVETKFHTHGINFHIFDVGGQRDQRKKWIQCFDDVTAIIFVADISSFNQTLAEDNETNRLEEALKVFNQIWNNRYLYHVSIILFLNKYDKFTDKIVDENLKLEDYFPAYKDYKCPEEINTNFYVPSENEEVTRAKMFILEEFINITRNSEAKPIRKRQSTGSAGTGLEDYSKFCMPYFTCAVDTENIRRVFKSCRSILRKENIIKSGLM